MWLKTRWWRRWVLGSGWITASTSRASETATEAQHSSKTIGLDLLLAWSWFERLSGFVNTNMRMISLFFTMITLCWFLHSQLINYKRKMNIEKWKLKNEHWKMNIEKWTFHYVYWTFHLWLYPNFPFFGGTMGATERHIFVLAANSNCIEITCLKKSIEIGHEKISESACHTIK